MADYTLWNLLPHPTGEHVVRLFARKGDVRVGDFARSACELNRFVRSANAKNMNVYVAPNPTTCTTGIRHTTKDVTHWSWFFFDIDPVATDETGSALAGRADPLKAMNRALTIFGEYVGRDFNRLPPLLIDSGRGVQAWLRLENVPLDDVSGTFDPPNMERRTARKIMGYWLKRVATELGTYKGCRLDTSVSDLPRVMRVPGTVNQKTGRSAEYITTDAPLNVGLHRILEIGTPPTVFREPEPGELPPGTPWQMAFPSLTLMSQNY